MLLFVAPLLAGDDGARFERRIWQATDGLPSPVVKGVLQDQKGFLWVMTPNGLSRFDGIHFVNYATGTAHETRTYFAVAESRDGSVWASSGNGLARVREGKLEFYTTNNGLASGYVLSAYTDREGTFWVGCDKGLCRFDGERFQRLTSKDGFPEQGVRAILEDRQGTLWVGTAQGLVEYSHGHATRHQDPAADRNAIQSLCQTRDGTIWAGTTAGLGYLVDGRWRPYLDRSGVGINATVRALYEDAEGTLWVGSLAGLMRLVNGQLLRVVTAGANASDFEASVPGYVFALCGDREGDIWVGSYGGLNCLTRRPFRFYTKEDGLQGEITCVLPSAGGCWIGTWGDGVAHYDGESMTVFGPSNGVPSTVRSLCSEPDGAVWIGSDREGLFRWQNGEITAHLDGAHNPSLNGNCIFSLCRDRTGGLWIGTESNLTQFKNGRFHPSKPMLPRARAILESKNGSLWVGYRDGLARIDHGRTEVIQPADQVRGMVNALYEDSSGTLWIGTETGWLFRYKNGNLDPAPMQRAMSRIVQLFQDDRQQLWVGSDSGIFRFKKAEIAAASATNAARFLTLPGMGRVECSGLGAPAASIDSHGQLWFATMSGLVVINPAASIASNPPPPVMIRRALAAGRPVEPGARFKLPSSECPVEFEFSAISLRAPQDLVFACQLSGVDRDWRLVGSARRAVYTDLRPGHYTFRVKARNGEGPWNEKGAQFSFELAPLFYQTGAFYALAPLLLLGGIIGGSRLAIRWRQRALRQRDEEVFQLIDQWTKNLQQEVAERKQAQRALEESQQFILRQERLAAVGQLAAGLAHEFNNIMTIIQGHAALLTETPGLDEESRTSVHHISDGVERTVKLVQQMLAFSRQQVMQQQPIDVKETLLLTEEMLRKLAGDTVKLTIEIAPALPRILADPNMFQQIIVNLVVNARDAMGRGGQLTIRGQAVQFSAADISVKTERKTGRFVKLSVRDTGQGMDAATINRLFEPFFTTKDVGKGSGLGLATVYGIIKQHKGWIEVASQIGSGTTFDLFFPVTDQKPETTPLPVGAGLAGGKETILVCEDEEVLRALVCEILAARGYRVIEASNGLQALHEWEEHRGAIDLLLTDISMPGGMTGRDLAARLRAENPQLPVIFSSGYAQHNSAPNGEDPVLTSYLSKPYRPAQLAHAVREALDSARNDQGPLPASTASSL